MTTKAQEQNEMTPELGVVVKGTENQPANFVAIRELGREEYRKYRVSSGRLLEWMFENQAVKAVQEAHEEYESTLQRYHTAHANHESIDALRMHRDIDTKVSNFLRAFRSFLDQSQKNLEDRYGKGKAQVKAFEKATNKAYDSSFSYRLLDQVRNYTQHVGSAVHNIPFGSHAAPGRREETEHYLRVELDRDKFLAWRKLKASVREEAKRLPSRIELSEHIKNVAHAVQEINVMIVAQQVFELQGHAHRVIDLVRPLKAWEGIPVILHMKLPEVEVGQWGTGNSNIEWIPVDLAEFVANPPRDMS
ncbi:MAG: hypothetical protein LC781_16135 [Actinobacteria bacterium]|nr:hypothetical protein [Actinomycetota bacterium]